MTKHRTPTSYEVDDEEPLRRLKEAAMVAGSLRSPVTNIAALLYRDHMEYYAGVLLARLAGKRRPPYRPFQKVEVANGGGAWEWQDGAPRLQRGSQYRIARVWYVEGQWWLELQGVKGQVRVPKYEAKDFKRVSESRNLKLVGAHP